MGRRQSDISDLETLSGWLLELTDQVGRRLRRHKRQGKTVQIKVRFSDFRTIVRSRTLSQPTDVTQELWRVASDLLAEAVPPGREAHCFGVRLLGVGISGFGRSTPVQLTLFDDSAARHAKQRQLDRVTDAVRERIGATSLGRGSGPKPSKPPVTRPL